MTLKQKKEKISGLIFKSESSGAVYLWIRKLQKAICIIGAKDRRQGMVIPLTDSCVGIKKCKFTFEYHMPSWIVLKEIYNLD